MTTSKIPKKSPILQNNFSTPLQKHAPCAKCGAFFLSSFPPPTIHLGVDAFINKH